jgi:hypothetical protein
MVIFVLVTANLAPVCILTLAEQATTYDSATEHRSTPWNLHYASAILALRSVWDTTGYWPLSERGLFNSKLLLELGGTTQPVGRVSIVVHLGLALILSAWGAWRHRRHILPQRATAAA